MRLYERNEIVSMRLYAHNRRQPNCLRHDTSTAATRHAERLNSGEISSPGKFFFLAVNRKLYRLENFRRLRLPHFPCFSRRTVRDRKRYFRRKEISSSLNKHNLLLLDSHRSASVECVD